MSFCDLTILLACLCCKNNIYRDWWPHILFEPNDDAIELRQYTVCSNYTNAVVQICDSTKEYNVRDPSTSSFISYQWTSCPC